ncbi:tautomerase family protein [Solibaculum mannosilyticum]|uniref:tautomerase family protein n=1 Tax=Solibaculum mannosilyticum TaxID=2780922 RepID=UPI0007A84DCC|nr:4-oxalocrotonate tautomerase [Eubacteriaceae bacterium CHKCI005]
MPHVTVHIVPGHSEEEKQRLAQRLHQTVQQELNMDGDLISVAIREVGAENWPAFIRTVPDFYVRPKYLDK